MLLHPLIAGDVAATLIEERLAEAARRRSRRTEASPPSLVAGRGVAVAVEPNRDRGTDVTRLLGQVAAAMTRDTPATPQHGTLSAAINGLLAAAKEKGRSVPLPVSETDPPIVVARTLGRLAEAVAGSAPEIGRYWVKAIEAALAERAFPEWDHGVDDRKRAA